MHNSPLEQHLSAIVEKRLGQLAKALSDARRAEGAEAVEAVHDLRVASRRLRAFGATFRELIPEATRRRLERKLKRVTRAVGALRDLDVQLERVEGRVRGATSELERASLEHLLEHLALRREPCVRRAERRLDEVPLDAITRQLERASRAVTQALSERDAKAYALTVLERLVTDAAEQTPPDGAEDAEGLHRLRIDVKGLRYALELFEPVLGSNFSALHARATTLQEVLGEYHDLVVLAELVEQWKAALAERNRHTLSEGLARTLEALATERKAVLDRFSREGFDARGWRDALQREAVPLETQPLETQPLETQPLETPQPEAGRFDDAPIETA